MELRARQARSAGRTPRKVQRWVSYTRISKNLTQAVILAEDNLFWQHEGVDLEEIKKSIEIAMERGGALRGASTITQQLAKNLYLSPSRDPLRKLRELIITRRLEVSLPKSRILEIYLNVVEWGDGIWGAEAAARTYFGVSAAALSREQAALLAGALINARVYSPARPPARLLRRQRIILARMGGVLLPAPPPVLVPPSSMAPPDQVDVTDELGPASEPAVEDVPRDGVPTLPTPDTAVPPAEPPPSQ